MTLLESFPTDSIEIQMFLDENSIHSVDKRNIPRVFTVVVLVVILLFFTVVEVHNFDCDLWIVFFKFLLVLIKPNLIYLPLVFVVAITV